MPLTSELPSTSMCYLGFVQTTSSRCCVLYYCWEDFCTIKQNPFCLFTGEEGGLFVLLGPRHASVLLLVLILMRIRLLCEYVLVHCVLQRCSIFILALMVILSLKSYSWHKSKEPSEQRHHIERVKFTTNFEFASISPQHHDYHLSKPSYYYLALSRVLLRQCSGMKTSTCYLLAFRLLLSNCLSLQHLLKLKYH